MLAVALLSGLFASNAKADPPFDPAIDVQLFNYAVGPKSFLTVSDGDVAGKKELVVDFLITYLTDPFTVYDVDETEDMIVRERLRVVENLVAGEVSGAYGLGNRLQIGAALPLVFSMAGQGIDPVMAQPSADGIQATGLGDLRVEAKMRFWESGPLRAAGAGGLTIPTSFGAGGSDFLGDNLPSVRGHGALQWRHPSGRATAGANLGAIFRKPRTIYASEVGQQLTFGLAAAANATAKVALIGEVFGRSALTTLDVDASPLELGGGVRVQATRSFSFLAGGGFGINEGIGSPGLRVFASLGYSPDFGDDDGDGVSNMKDACPLEAEDLDDFEDGDGCPDRDNDGDLRSDAIDKCPNDKEDLDGFEDDDGCPEEDNDKDGLADGDDKCPNHAEDGLKPFDKDGCPASKRDSDDDTIADDQDKCPDDPEDIDGFDDADGCPDPDNDLDGIADEDDQCPLCREDKDGFADEDGCADPDNDRDGIADAVDQCPDQAETLNGVADTDGCPDRGGSQAARLDGDRIIVDAKIRFRSSDALRKRTLKHVDQVASLMLANADVVKWRIVVVAPKQSNDAETRQKSQRQADAVKARIIEMGVPASAVEAIGAVADKPLVAVAAIERDEEAARTCPAESRAKPSATPSP